MNETEARTVVGEAVASVAPDVDVTTIDPGGPLQEQADLDSMDFLGVLAAIEERCGVVLSDTDPELRTLNGLVHQVLTATDRMP